MTLSLRRYAKPRGAARGCHCDIALHRTAPADALARGEPPVAPASSRRGVLQARSRSPARRLPEQSGVDDDARDHRCKAMARHLYDAVIEIYVGGDYAALRQ